MSKYYDGVLEVEAVELTTETAAELTHWCQGLLVEEVDPLNSDVKYVGINVPTLTGPKRASEGSYIVKTKLGAFYTVTAYYFKKNFKEA